MPEQPGAGRLDVDTLAAYVDGLLPAEERAKVEAEIATDPETYEWVVNTVNAVEDASIATVVPAVGGDGSTERGNDEPSRSRVIPFYRHRWFMGGTGSLLAAAAAMVLVVRMEPQWWQRLRGSQMAPLLATLVDAVGEERYVEARLTGGFKYGPLRPVMRGPEGASSQNLQLMAAAAALRRAADRSPTAMALRGAGIASLLTASPDTAVSLLERACSAEPTDTCASDLCAARIERHKNTRSPEDLRLALAQCDEALRLNPSLAAAHFNRALTLTYLGDQRAADAWATAAKGPSTDPWSREAQVRRAAVADRLPR